MTTSWRSSLAQIENRLRRSFGAVAGPIDLILSPNLTPVVLADDSTRAGAPSGLRGRRWMATTSFGGTIAAGQRGSSWLYADGIYGPSGSSDPYAGGVNVDGMLLCPSSSALLWTLYSFPTDLVLSPGIPLAVTPDNGVFVDGPRATESAPIALYGQNNLPPETGGGKQIWRYRTSGGNATFYQPLEIFLNWNSALSIGIDPLTVPGAAVDCNVTFFGRIF